MAKIRRFDHVGITVADLDRATEFFLSLGLELDGRSFVEGEFIDTVIGIPDSRTEVAMLHAPDGGSGVELSSFVRPDPVPGSPSAPANALGLRSVAFEVNDLEGCVARVAADGYVLVGAIGEYEGIWRMAYVRGPGRADRLSRQLDRHHHVALDEFLIDQRPQLQEERPRRGIGR